MTNLPILLADISSTLAATIGAVSGAFVAGILAHVASVHLSNRNRKLENLQNALNLHVEILTDFVRDTSRYKKALDNYYFAYHANQHNANRSKDAEFKLKLEDTRLLFIDAYHNIDKSLSRLITLAILLELSGLNEVSYKIKMLNKENADYLTQIIKEINSGNFHGSAIEVVDFGSKNLNIIESCLESIVGEIKKTTKPNRLEDFKETMRITREEVKKIVNEITKYP